MEKIKKYALLGLTLACLTGCASDPNKPWTEMSDREKRASVESRVDRVLWTEKNVGRGDTAKELNALLAVLPDTAPEDYSADLKRALEACDRLKLPEQAAIIQEKLGEFGQAALCAKEAGDMLKAAQLMAKADDVPPEIAREIQGALLEEGRDQLDKADKWLKKNKLKEATKNIGRAQENFAPIQLERADRNRLLFTQLALAEKQQDKDAVGQLIDATVEYHLANNENDAGRTELLHLSRSLLVKGQYPIAHKFLSKARTGSEKTPMSSENKKLALRLVLASKFGRGHFAEASKMASKGGAAEKQRADVYRYALKGPDVSVGAEPFPFTKPKRADKPQTYLYVYSPGPTETEFVKSLDNENTEFEVEPSVHASKEGLKIHMKTQDDRRFFVEFLSGAYRPLEKKAYLNAKSVSRSPMIPSLAFSGDTAFSEGQFIIHEIVVDKNDGDKPLRFAADFIGSHSGNPADMRFGKIRYNSHFE